MSSKPDLQPTNSTLDDSRRRLLELMATRLEEEREASLMIASRPRPETGLPLSFAQEQLWFLEQVHPTHGAYNLPTALRLRGHLQVWALQQGLDELVKRHEILRARFKTHGGHPVQVIAPPHPVALHVEDLTGLAPGDCEARLRQVLREKTLARLDLSRGPLFRALLIRIADQEHVLLIIMHHIISDGWSMGIVLRELGLLYEAHLQGRTSSLPPLEVQYPDYVLWQREWLQGEVLEKQLAYWKAQLIDAPTTLELPTDRPRPTVPSFKGALRTFRLPAAFSGRITELAKHEGATLYMLSLAVLQVVLSRWTGQLDILIGSPIAGRTHHQTEGLIGLFVNMLVMRGNLRGDPTFRELLARTKETALQANAHQEQPLEKLVAELQPERDLARQALFQVVLLIENITASSSRWSGLEVLPMELGIAASRFDITLDIFERGSELAGWVEYAADLFDEVTMDRFLSHYIHLLEQVVQNPQARLSELSILTELERHQLLVDWNRTMQPYPADRCAHEVFQEQALRFPHAIAVVGGEGELSYGDLDRRANRCAHFLRERGVGPEKIVGIYSERSTDMVVAMLAVLKAGGMYLPLDVSLPAARVDFMIEDSGAQIVLTTRGWAARRQTRGAAVFCVDDPGLLATFPDYPVDRAVSGVSASSGAYTIYTSGSTGQPKGVINTHAGLVNLCRWHAEAFGTGQNSRCTLIASIGFDAAVWELWSALLAGACVVPVDDTTRATPHLLTELMRGQRITHCFIPTGLLEAMAGTGTFSGPDLRVILCGGDKLSRYCLPADARAKLFNCYGPTEAAVVSTVYEMKPESPPLIGRPIANVQAYVLNGVQELQPIGVIGELYIGGASLARGYLGRGGLTAAHFVANPFGLPGSRLYATGDRVRYLADGNLEYRGRVDQQVKVRGFRIEPGEVETALLRHPALREAAVVVREERGDKMLVAYLVAASDDVAPDSQSLREFLKKGLPEYMIPAVFMLLPALPLTPHGKVDRQRLPEPELGNELQYVAPRTPTEEVLAKVWADVLKLERVGIHDNFFELGGMSMTALRVVDQAAQAGLVFMPTDLFEWQTIAELAGQFSIGPTQATQASHPEGEVPLTPIQHMFMRQSPQLIDTFTIFAEFEATQPLRPALLQQAVKYVAAHHDALAVQIIRDTKLIQRILPAEDLQYDKCFTEVNLSHLDASHEASVFREIGSAARRRVTAAEPPLLYAVLINRGPGQPQQFLLVTHHFVTDNWSIRILLEDIQTVYQQLATGQSPLLPVKTTSFKAWTERLTAYARSEEFETDVAVWHAQQWSDYGTVPLDYPKREYELGSDETLSLRIDRNEADSLLDSILREQRAQSTEVFLAALAETLLQWTGKSAVAIDLLSAGRATCFPRFNVARTVGWFSAPVPVLLQKQAALDPIGMLRQVKSCVRSLPNEGLAYGIGKFLLDHDAGLVDMPQVCLNNWGGQSRNDSLFCPSPYVFYDDPQPGTFKRHHLIDLVITTGTQALGMHWSFSRNMHRRETIAKLAEDYIANLRFLSGGKLNSYPR